MPKKKASKPPETLRVRFLECRVGEVDGKGFVDRVGSEKDLSRDEALRVVDAGQAELVKVGGKEQTVAP